MAPKNPKTNGERNGKTAENGTASNTKTSSTQSDSKKGEKSGVGNRKRKVDSPSIATPSKAQRRSVRSVPPTKLSPQEQIKLLNYLLSPSCLPQTRPADEIKDIESRGGDSKVRTYSASDFTPLEELLSAMILSRPIGHMLGVRSIRTLFNPPHNLNTLGAIQNAGREGCRAALDEARTQHRQKTADQLVTLAEFVSNSEDMDEHDTGLEAVRKASGYDPNKEREMLQSGVKGLGKTGLDIFGRRIQAVWAEWYPFGDGRTMAAVEKLGLPGDVKKLNDLIVSEWNQLEVPKELVGKGEETQRKVFVRILERAIGADLEGNLEDVKKQGLK